MSRTPSTVPPKLLRVIDALVQAGIPQDFYLAGGTGLALLLGHRHSVDLDWFSRTNRLDFTGRRSLLSRFRRLARWQLIEAKDGTVHGSIGTVRVSFFWYPEPLVRPLVKRGVLRMAAVEDIGLMKIGAVIGRGSRKDFVDLYAICRQVPLSRLLAMGRKKFRHSRDFILQALKALRFFEDAEREPSLETPPALGWPRVKAFFMREVDSLSRRYLA